jgi:signal transduction histidine kinase
VAAPAHDPLRLSRQVYVLRILGLTLGSIGVAAVFSENSAAQRRSAPRGAHEPWRSIRRWAASGSRSCTAGACLVGAILTGFAYSPATDMPVIVASLPLMFGYPIAVAFASYESGRIARQRTQQTAELREQLAHIPRVGTLGEMAAGLAHELNQPLTAIHFEAAALLEMPEEEAIPAMRDALTSIAEQSLRAGAIVRGMRTFARRTEEKRELVDIRQLIDEVLALLAHDLRLNNVETITALNDVPDVMSIGSRCSRSSST